MGTRPAHEFAVTSRAGSRSATNQDLFWLLPESGLAVLVDGRSDRPGGNVASRVTLEVLQRVLSPAARRDTFDGYPRGTADVLRVALAEANRQLFDLQRPEHYFRPMGAAVVIARFLGRHVALAHVGDSRCYVVRGEAVHRLTTDHVLLEESRPFVSAEDLEVLVPLQRVLTRAVGQGAELSIDVRIERLDHGERYLLCTNGIWEVVSEAEMATILRSTPDLRAACRHLVSLAARRGDDDATAILVRPHPRWEWVDVE
jgi:serine/threonine protein phosphatase PrpC